MTYAKSNLRFSMCSRMIEQMTNILSSNDKAGDIPILTLAATLGRFPQIGGAVLDVGVASSVCDPRDSSLEKFESGFSRYGGLDRGFDV